MTKPPRDTAGNRRQEQRPAAGTVAPTDGRLHGRLAKPIRLILADDHTLVRAGIRSLLEQLPGVQVVGEADDGRQVLDLVKQHQPDVVLMDISMPGLNGLEAAARIAKEYSQVRVIILSMHNNEEYYWRALKSGAAGYLLKKAATAELETALQQVLQGEIYLSQEISARLLKKLPLAGLADRKSPLEQLTSRQREILQLIAEGQNTKQIGEILKVSPKTVEYHRMKLMDGLNVHDIPGLVRFALRTGLIPQEN
jgi:DNA-binding NarL/FixJ family response regulator